MFVAAGTSSVRCNPCRAKERLGVCLQCGGPVQKSHPRQERKFCSRACASRNLLLDPEYRKKFYTDRRSKKISASRKETFKNDPERHARFLKSVSDGMTKYMASLTPEQMLARRKRSSDILRAIGHKPCVRGGNGTGKTKPEEILLAMLPEAVWNYPVRTGMKSGSGFPTCYKLDVAIPRLMLGIEADGNSHNHIPRREQDAKKVAFLKTLGWTVVRFRNELIIENPNAVLSELTRLISDLDAKYSKTIRA